MSSERVLFRLLVMPCCHHQLCWVNPRLPTYCPECGVCIHATVKESVLIRDERATLRYNSEALV
jgi:hypothetical protein